MTHHRCTRCKQESFPRHKWKGGVYCDDCIQAIKGGGRHSGVFGWVRGLWEKLTVWIDKIFRPQTPKALERVNQRQILSRMKQMEHKARSIPTNPQTMSPQKR